MRKRRKPLYHSWRWLLHHKGLVLSLLALLLLVPAGGGRHEKAVAVPAPGRVAGPEKRQEEPQAKVEEARAARPFTPAPIHITPPRQQSFPPAPPPIPPPHAGRPRIAIVIDDMGLDEKQSRRAIAELPAAITLSFIPFTPHVQRLVDAARAAGHEVLLHLPMQAENDEPAGTGELKTEMSDEDIRAQTMRDLDGFSGYDGVNNHMGSAFTADEHAMRVFLSVLQERGLAFLDSRTTAETKGEILAREMEVPVIRRHVFLDHSMGEKNIMQEANRLITLAKRNGYAVAIGHPHPVTLDFLVRKLPELTRDVELVPLRTLIQK